MDSKEIKPLNSKGNQPWIFIGRTDAEAEAPILWWLDMKSQLTGKYPDAGKDWEQEDLNYSGKLSKQNIKRITQHEQIGFISRIKQKFNLGIL